jgi:RNA polymerase sigma factor (TIGR02999 family)
MDTVAEQLSEARSGARDTFDRVLPIVYAELRRAAHRELNRRPNDTLNTTGLVHEMYLRLRDNDRVDWEDRACLLGMASVAMRRILVDRARRRRAMRRGGGLRQVTLEESVSTVEERAESLLELDEALERLTRYDERLVRVVECRFFGGLSETETAQVLGVTERTVRRDWVKARGLLYQTLGA